MFVRNLLITPLLLTIMTNVAADSIFNWSKNSNVTNLGGNANTGNIVIDGNVISGNNNILKGSGNKKSMTKKVNDFNKIVVSNALDVVFTQGSKSDLEITGDDNIIPAVHTEVNNGVLLLGIKKSYSASMPIIVSMQSPSISAITVTGASDVTLRSINTDKLQINLTGTGDISASGKVKSLSINVQGTGDINSKNLDAESVHVQLSGSGDIVLTALNSLVAELVGSGDILYYGHPEKIDKKIVGTGDFEAGD
jgi:hypothetical protein